MKEIVIKTIDALIGPLLDECGSFATDETWVAQNVCVSTLIDKKTGKTLGQEIYAVRDDIVSVAIFNQPTVLRSKVKLWLYQKLKE